MSYLNEDSTTKFQVAGSIIFIYLSNTEYARGVAKIIHFLLQELRDKIKSFAANGLTCNWVTCNWGKVTTYLISLDFRQILYQIIFFLQDSFVSILHKGNRENQPKKSNEVLIPVSCKILINNFSNY